MFWVYLSYLIAMAVGITVLAILFVRDSRKAAEDLAKMAEEEEDEEDEDERRNSATEQNYRRPL